LFLNLFLIQQKNHLRFINFNLAKYFNQKSKINVFAKLLIERILLIIKQNLLFIIIYILKF